MNLIIITKAWHSKIFSSLVWLKYKWEQLMFFIQAICIKSNWVLNLNNYFLNLVIFSFENNLFLFVYSLLNPILWQKNHSRIWLVSVFNFSQIWGWRSYFFPKSQAGHVKMFLNFWEISAWCSYKLGSYKKKECNGLSRPKAL